jgi:hypothetical protein
MKSAFFFHPFHPLYAIRDMILCSMPHWSLSIAVEAIVLVLSTRLDTLGAARV